jgi:nucleoside-diphosphate-sugar epimerase
MRVLLTGDTGFIGSHAAGYILERHHEVAVVETSPTASARTSPAIFSHGEGMPVLY